MRLRNSIYVLCVRFQIGDIEICNGRIDFKFVLKQCSYILVCGKNTFGAIAGYQKGVKKIRLFFLQRMQATPRSLFRTNRFNFWIARFDFGILASTWEPETWEPETWEPETWEPGTTLARNSFSYFPKISKKKVRVREVRSEVQIVAYFQEPKIYVVKKLKISIYIKILEMTNSYDTQFVVPENL